MAITEFQIWNISVIPKDSILSVGNSHSLPSSQANTDKPSLLIVLHFPEIPCKLNDVIFSILCLDFFHLICFSMFYLCFCMY